LTFLLIREDQLSRCKIHHGYGKFLVFLKTTKSKQRTRHHRASFSSNSEEEVPQKAAGELQ